MGAGKKCSESRKSCREETPGGDDTKPVNPLPPVAGPANLKPRHPMRICVSAQNSSDPYGSGRKIPLEVNLWLDRGWTIIQSERQGVVLLGKKELRKRDRVLLWLGIFGLAFFFVGIPIGGWAGLLMLTLAWVDYSRNTVSPTKFFPAEGEKPRKIAR